MIDFPVGEHLETDARGQVCMELSVYIASGSLPASNWGQATPTPPIEPDSGHVPLYLKPTTRRLVPVNLLRLAFAKTAPAPADHPNRGSFDLVSTATP